MGKRQGQNHLEKTRRVYLILDFESSRYVVSQVYESRLLSFCSLLYPWSPAQSLTYIAVVPKISIESLKQQYFQLFFFFNKPA